MSLEQKVGELIGHSEAQTQKLDRLLDGMERVIPAIARHEEKHDDLEKLWIPKIQEHDANFDGIMGAFKLASFVGGALVGIGGLLLAFLG